MGAIERDADGSFGLGEVGRGIDNARGNRCANFVGNERQVHRGVNGNIVWASALQTCTGLLRGMLRDGSQHDAVMLAVAPAAGRYVRVRSGHRKEWRDQ